MTYIDASIPQVTVVERSSNPSVARVHIGGPTVASSYDDSIPDDTLGLADPDTIDAAFDAIVAMFAGFGVTLPSETVDIYKYLVALHVTEQPSTVKLAIDNLLRLAELLYGGQMSLQLQVAEAATASSRLIDVAAPSIGINYTGRYWRLGGRDSYDEAKITGPTIPPFEGDGLDIRVLYRPVDYGSAFGYIGTYSELLTFVHPNNGVLEADILELALKWRDGRVRDFVEWTQDGELDEVGHADSVGPTPDVWQEARCKVRWATGVVEFQRRVDEGEDETTDDGTKWRTHYSVSVTDGPTSIYDVTGIVPQSGIGPGRLDLARLEVRDGIDGTLRLSMDANDVDGDGNVPDGAADGLWEPFTVYAAVTSDAVERPPVVNLYDVPFPAFGDHPDSVRSFPSWSDAGPTAVGDWNAQDPNSLLGVPFAGLPPITALKLVANDFTASLNGSLLAVSTVDPTDPICTVPAWALPSGGDWTLDQCGAFRARWVTQDPDSPYGWTVHRTDYGINGRLSAAGEVTIPDGWPIPAPAEADSVILDFGVNPWIPTGHPPAGYAVRSGTVAVSNGGVLDPGYGLQTFEVGATTATLPAPGDAGVGFYATTGADAVTISPDGVGELLEANGDVTASYVVAAGSVVFLLCTGTAWQVVYDSSAGGGGGVSGPGSSADGTVALFDGTSGNLLQDSGVTLGSAASADTGDFDPAGAASTAQSAAQTYAEGLFNANDALVYKGAVDCSANPNYPAADAGHFYKVSVAGKIGGASGVNVQVGDTLVCTTDSTVSGNQATVGSAWNVIQANIDGAVIGPASSTDGNMVVFDGATGKLIKDSGIAPSSKLDASSTKVPPAPDALADNGMMMVASGLWVAKTAAQVKTALALTVGTDVQAHGANLDALSGVTSAANKMFYFTGSGTGTVADLSVFARTILDDADAAAVAATLGLTGLAGQMIGTTGDYWPVGNPSTITTGNLTSGRAYYVPFYLPRACAFDRAGMTVTAAASASSTIEIGLHANTGQRPGARLYTWGNIDGASATSQEVTLGSGTGVTLAAGFYWYSILAVLTGGTLTVRTLSGSTSTSIPANSLANATTQNNNSLIQNSLATLPNPAVPNAAPTNIAPLLAFRVYSS